MEKAPRFPSLFFRQRLNATALPMLCGIFLFLLLPPVYAVCSVTLMAVPMIFFAFRREDEIRKTLLCALAGLSLAMMVIGLRGLERHSLEKLCHKPLWAEGYVMEKGEGYFDLSLESLDGESFHKRIRIESEEGWKLGEKRRLLLVLHSPDPEGDRADGAELLAKLLRDDGVVGKSYLYTFVGDVRQSLTEDFSRRENGGFLGAVLLGDKSGLTSEQNDAFRRTASSHILAISGLHISQAIAFLVCLLSFLPISRRVTRILLFPFVAVLYLLAGAGISVFRASVMTLFSVFGLLLKRRADSLTALSFSAALLAMANPYTLESPSFLLSYASTFGIVTCAVPLCEYVRDRFEEKGMHLALRWLVPLVLSAIMASVSFVFTTPVQLILFGTASLFAPIYAILLIPPFQICLILTLLGACFVPISSFLSDFLLSLAAKYPRLVEFLAKGAPAPIDCGKLGCAFAVVMIVSLVLMFRKRLPLTLLFLLHGSAFLFFGIFSLLQSFFL